tara:strand:+ start:3273 stop:3599 length:327 start_codon:yes stop_codon:yes gene_type:complete
MAKSKKFTEDELKGIQELQQKYAATTDAFGRLRVQKMLMNQQFDALEDAEAKLENDYTELQKSEQELVQSLNDKYGAGSLDINTGEFTPTETAETADTGTAPSAAPNS